MHLCSFLSTVIVLHLFQLGEVKGISDGMVTLSPTCKYRKTDFRKLATSALSAIDFYEKNVNKLVLDAAIGTRMIEAQLATSLSMHTKLPEEMRTFLNKLVRRAFILSERIISQIQRRPDITDLRKQENLPWVKNTSIWGMPYDEWKDPEILNKYPLFHSEIFFPSVDEIDEETSDACISEVLHGCKISNKCADKFLKKEHSMYSLTHQVIYMLFAAEKKCVEKDSFLKHVDGGNWKHFMERLCGRVWGEANVIEISNFPTDKRDIFTEQIPICSLAGYPNFLKRDWLERILSWQSSKGSGCFFNSRRRKREDVEIKTRSDNRCSVHFTSVALSAIAIHMRYFIDTCLSNY